MRYRMEKILKKKFKKEDFEYLINNTAGRGLWTPGINYFPEKTLYKHFVCD